MSARRVRPGHRRVERASTFGHVTITLTIRTAPWRAHVARVAASVEGLVPVVKGNGYGFGRNVLARIASEFSDIIAVGTIHELHDLPGGVEAVVLTPTLTPPVSDTPILTVGNNAHIEALRGWPGRVVVKLESSMRRFGAGPTLVNTALTAGLEVVGVSIHPPLAGSSADHAEEIRRIVDGVDPGITVWVSHIDPEHYAELAPTHSYRLRLGTSLWHADKSLLSLSADVLDVRRVESGDRVGYRLAEVAGAGHVVMIGAGSANGVTPLPDGRSPFHFDRTRLDLHEPPHMHTSMGFVPDGRVVPSIGERVDVQRPLVMTAVDQFEWI